MPEQAGSYYLAIDSGGSKTLVVIVNEQGQEVGRGQAGGSNHNNIGLEKAMRNLHLAVERAVQAAGCQLPVRKAWLGVAGMDRPADHSLLYPYVSSLAEAVYMTNDAELGLSALEHVVGVAIIAGTGSIILGRDGHGKKTRSGGWGYLLGDEGSGYYVAHEGAIAALRYADGRGEPTLLLDLILQHWGLSSHDDIIGQVYIEDSKAKIATLSPLVFKAARQGDAIAAQIVRRGAYELALGVKAVCARLDLPTVPLALCGSLLVHEADYRAQVLGYIAEEHEVGRVAIVEDAALSAARAIVNLTL